MLWTIALIHILVKDNPHYGSFLLVDVQFVQFMLALVDTPTPYKVIAIRRISALEVTFFYKLAQTGAGTDGSLFAFSVRLPESDVVQQFVSVVVETLLTLLGTPYPDSRFCLRWFGWEGQQQLRHRPCNQQPFQEKRQ